MHSESIQSLESKFQIMKLQKVFSLVLWISSIHLKLQFVDTKAIIVFYDGKITFDYVRLRIQIWVSNKSYILLLNFKFPT